jgi:hypothetical protein
MSHYISWMITLNLAFAAVSLPLIVAATIDAVRAR